MNEIVERLGALAWTKLYPFAGPWKPPGDPEQDATRAGIRELIHVLYLSGLSWPTEAMMAAAKDPLARPLWEETFRKQFERAWNASPISPKETAT